MRWDDRNGNRSFRESIMSVLVWRILSLIHNEMYISKLCFQPIWNASLTTSRTSMRYYLDHVISLYYRMHWFNCLFQREKQTKEEHVRSKHNPQFIFSFSPLLPSSEHGSPSQTMSVLRKMILVLKVLDLQEKLQLP